MSSNCYRTFIWFYWKTQFFRFLNFAESVGNSRSKEGHAQLAFWFFSSTQVALWDFQLDYAIPFFSFEIWALSENLKLISFFFSHTESCQLWYDSLWDLVSLNQFGVCLFFWELLTFFLVYIFHCNWVLNIIIVVTGEHRFR